MTRKKPKQAITVQFVAPYRQSEAALNASAIASFVSRKLKDVRTYKFRYLTPDSMEGYCSPFIDHQVYRLISPRDFDFHSSDAGATYWFGNSWEPIGGPRAGKNYLFANYTAWDGKAVRKSKKYTAVIMPSTPLAQRTKTLVSCLDPPVPIYPGSYRSLSPVRNGLLNPDRVAALLSMCGINRPSNRLAILKQVVTTVSSRKDVFITLLMDGQGFKEEKQLLEHLGLNHSDRCVVVDRFSDYEYCNMLAHSDVFVDLNPINATGYFLSTALHAGLAVCGFSQPLYRDLLNDGEYGMLIGGTTRNLGFDFDFVVPDWARTFKILNDKTFSARWLPVWLDKRNDRPSFLPALEARTKMFFSMFAYLTNAAVKLGDFAKS